MPIDAYNFVQLYPLLLKRVRSTSVRVSLTDNVDVDDVAGLAERV